MLKRLVVGLLEGGLSGALVALLVARLSLSWDTPWIVYAASVLVGVLTGLVAGKPIWAKGAKTEATIKAITGAFIATVTMFGIRKWLPNVTVHVSSIRPGALGEVPFAALPVVGAALALVFEVDDAFGGETAPRHRVSAESPRDAEEEEIEESSQRSARRRR